MKSDVLTVRRKWLKDHRFHSYAPIFRPRTRVVVRDIDDEADQYWAIYRKRRLVRYNNRPGNIDYVDFRWRLG